MRFEIRISFVLFFCCLLFLSQSLTAQYHYKPFKPYWETYVGVGFNQFFGDIKQNEFMPATTGELDELKYAFTLGFSRQLSLDYGIRLQYTKGNLLGILTSVDRYFEADYMDVSLLGTANLTNILWGYYAKRKTFLYGIVGLGLMNYKTTLSEISTNEVLNTNGFGDGSGLNGQVVEGVVLVGLGYEVKLSNYYALKFELLSRILNSDRLDLTNGGSKFDAYTTLLVGFSYKIFDKRRRRPSRYFRKR